MSSINKRTKKADLTTLLYGKVQPQATELESAIIGAMLIEPSCINKVFNLIKTSEVFYVDAHQRIFASIKRLMDNGTSVDFKTISEDLRKQSELEMVGGSYYIMTLTRDVVSSANIESHIRIVLEKYFKRELIRIASQIVSENYEDSGDIFESLDSLKITLDDINEKIELSSYREFNQILNNFLQDIDEDIKNIDNGGLAVKTFLPDYDEVLGNLEGGNVYVIAARTSMGKTAFEIAITLLQSEHFDVGIWNGELTEKRMILRYISNISGITVLELRKNPKLYHKEILNAVEDLVQKKIHMDNTKNIDIEQLINKIKYWVFNKKCKVIWLDYVQVIKMAHALMKMLGTKTEQTGYIIDRLNEVSALCNVPIMLLAQVNREALKNGDKRPTLANLRDSGSIEERVYHVSFLHRPEYYNEQEFEGKSTENMMQIIVAKNGDGGINKTIEIKHDLKYNRIFSMGELYEPFKQIDTETPF